MRVTKVCLNRKQMIDGFDGKKLGFASGSAFEKETDTRLSVKELPANGR